MDREIKRERGSTGSPWYSSGASKSNSAATNEANSRATGNNESKRRRCVSTACIACRRRKSKCDGAHPACAACVSVYNTECIYDPASDHRRKGVYKKDIDNLKTRNSTLQTLVQAILNYPEDEIPDLVWKIRACESLDKVAESIIAQENGTEEDDEPSSTTTLEDTRTEEPPTFESRLASKVGALRLENGAVRMFGGTSNLIFLEEDVQTPAATPRLDQYRHPADPITSWTSVTSDPELVTHLLNHYFAWHYTFFTVLPKAAFYKHFRLGKPPVGTRQRTEFCTPLLVNAMLALGCHFTSYPAARSDPEDSATAGDHFFQEAKWLLYEEDELATPRLATVQALALMSVREAGCGREAKGWVYSGMAFRMACDLGLSFHSNTSDSTKKPDRAPNEVEEDARRITFWGCFMIDKCWSQYLGRLPIFQLSTNITIPKFEVFPSEDSENWLPYSDSGFTEANSQPSRVRAVALQISVLCEISSDLIKYFYHPQQLERPVSKQQEMKRLSEIHSRLEEWKRELPKELEPKEGILSSILIMHMLFQLLYIHLFRPFLKYTQNTSPLPSHVSPRKLCTQAAGTISKLLRLYKRSHGLRQIVNIAVYICHSACTIHLLNLPEKTARRDITHGVKHLEEIADGWLCARRTLRVLSTQARKWKVELPEEAASVLARTDSKFGSALSSPSKTPAEASPELSHGKDTSQYVTSQERTNSYSPGFDLLGIQAQPTMQPPQVPFVQTNSQYNSVPQYAAANPGAVAIPYPQNTSSNQHFQMESTNSSPGQLMQGQISPQSVHSHQSASDLLSRKRKPSEIFGGVEALLREGQEWWMNDQSQIASGFDNWNYGTANGKQPTQRQTVPQPQPQQLQQQQQQQQHHHHQHQHQQRINNGSNAQAQAKGQGANAMTPMNSDTRDRRFSARGGGASVSANNVNQVYDKAKNNAYRNTNTGAVNGSGFGFGTYTNLNESAWYE